jgi:CelD/BcsL family acetyltransferase involved in cellulose biosynthesis
MIAAAADRYAAGPPTRRIGRGSSANSSTSLRSSVSRPEWDRLVSEALEPTPFFSRHVIGTHAAHGMIAADLAFLAVRTGGRLVALLPITLGARRVGWLGRANTAWGSPYTPASTPLVARDLVLEAVHALVDGLARIGGQLWLLPSFRLDDAIGGAFVTELERRNWPATVIDRRHRPVLDRRPDLAAYLAELPSKRCKDIRRRERRLADAGEVRFASAIEGGALDAAVATFLSLEQAGWKGRRGTALGNTPHGAAFARALFQPMDAPVTARADVLSLNDVPIAASLALRCGSTTYLLKSAYDEAYARLAPGLALEDAIVRDFHRNGEGRLNAATDAANPLDQLYPDREEIGSLLFRTRPGGSVAGLGQNETTRRRLLKQAKSAVLRVKELRLRSAS